MTRRWMKTLHAEALFAVGGDPDWMAVADDAVWVAQPHLGRVTQLNASTNTVGKTVPVDTPCSGLIAGYGSLWIPSCGSHALVRADLRTGEVQAIIAAAPAASEGGIAVGAGSVWMVTSAMGTLSRIDPATNRVVATVSLPSGSYCPLFAGGSVWVTSSDHNVVSQVDPAQNKVVRTISVGKGPRFLTAGAGSVWTLNQGDGTISQVDMASGRLIANLDAKLAGKGGEMTFGFGSVWATLFRVPITRIAVGKRASIVSRWAGSGGDSIRAGLGSIWLTDMKAGTVLRLSPHRL